MRSNGRSNEYTVNKFGIQIRTTSQIAKAKRDGTIFSRNGEGMTDPRIKKLAQVMVHYSLAIKPGQKVYLQTTPAAHDFNLAFYEEAIKAGAHVTFAIDGGYYPGAQEIFLKHASQKQLGFVSPVRKLLIETYDARMVVEAETNTRELAGVDPKRIALWRKSNGPLFKKMLKRIESGDLKWCLTVVPTDAMAQEANMSLSDYRE